MAVTGQTQESGKTTTLEALISRSDLRAVAFITKRAEGRFRRSAVIRPYFRERADWQFVASVLEATMREKMKFERAWIMRATKGAHSLADVQHNVQTLMEKSRGLSADMYLQLDEYLKIVVPQIERLSFTNRLDLRPGLNVMDLSAYTMELQALVIRSVLEWVYERESDTVVIIPEAWEFIPQRRGSPVLLAAEELIRKGAAAKNYIWLDSQDLAGVNAAIRKSVIVWLLGVQREANEVERMLAHIPSVPKPKGVQIMQLGLGEFFVCWGRTVKEVYVQPAWMDDQDALAIAQGKATVAGTMRLYNLGAQAAGRATVNGEDEMSAEERAKYEQEIARLQGDLDKMADTAGKMGDRAEQAEREAATLHRQLDGFKEVRGAISALRTVLGVKATGGNGPVDEEAIVAKVLRRIPAGGAVVQVTPPEVLRKEFQQKEVERILAFVRGLEPRPRDAVRLLEGAAGTWIGVKALAARLDVPQTGNSFTVFSKAINAMADEGYVERQERLGVKGSLRTKITTDLAYYQATPEEIDLTYQQVLFALAGGA